MTIIWIKKSEEENIKFLPQTTHELRIFTNNKKILG